MRIDVEPGTKTETFLEAEGPGPNGLPVAIRVPVGIVRGVHDGPVFSAIAGVHGAEYCGIEAVIRLYREADPQQISGTLITAIANLPAFLERSMYVCPVDDKNLGRFFPGDPGGTYSQVLAHHVFENLVRPADYVVDLHGGDAREAVPVFRHNLGYGGVEGGALEVEGDVVGVAARGAA